MLCKPIRKCPWYGAGCLCLNLLAISFCWLSLRPLGWLTVFCRVLQSSAEFVRADRNIAALGSNLLVMLFGKAGEAYRDRFALSLLKQLCGRHHLPVLLCLRAAHLRHIPQRLLWVRSRTKQIYVKSLFDLFDECCKRTKADSFFPPLPSAVQSPRSCSPTSHR